MAAIGVAVPFGICLYAGVPPRFALRGPRLPGRLQHRCLPLALTPPVPRGGDVLGDPQSGRHPAKRRAWHRGAGGCPLQAALGHPAEHHVHVARAAPHQRDAHGREQLVQRRICCCSASTRSSALVARTATPRPWSVPRSALAASLFALAAICHHHLNLRAARGSASVPTRARRNGAAMARCCGGLKAPWADAGDRAVDRGWVEAVPVNDQNSFPWCLSWRPGPPMLAPITAHQPKRGLP